MAKKVHIEYLDKNDKKLEEEYRNASDNEDNDVISSNIYDELKAKSGNPPYGAFAANVKIYKDGMLIDTKGLAF